jgi:hypothetical protein
LEFRHERVARLGGCNGAFGGWSEQCQEGTLFAFRKLKQLILVLTQYGLDSRR